MSIKLLLCIRFSSLTSTQADKAQVDNAQADKDNVPFVQLEDGAFPDLDGDDFFYSFGII